MSNYPLGAKNDSNAPYNKSINDSITVEVLVSITISKPVKIKVDDYICSKDMDEDGSFTHYDYSDCDFKTAFENQYGTPEQLFKGWDVDDYEIILN